MFTLIPTLMMIFFSMAAGGGARGKDAGIAHSVMIQVGATIEALHLFIEVYHQVGEMITGNAVGKGSNGNINEYLTSKFNRIGTNGKRINIGKNKIIGVFEI
ncbi:MAG: hypothetical protein A2031_08855 [Deltaproteobacteria bacterium RBG_19FT_COMBO_43_11]|nr:MAG: hypothetical protein A2031_08855 [Deltaproteobacteria bacterium RBG_19FT_COMBO_43_11]